MNKKFGGSATASLEELGKEKYLCFVDSQKAFTVRSAEDSQCAG